MMRWSAAAIGDICEPAEQRDPRNDPAVEFPLREDCSYYRRRFDLELGDRLRAAGLRAEVFVWDDFHDRYLIGNLVGVSLPNGFDTTNNPNDTTTWSRLGREERDDIQREFDPASRRHTLHQRFTIP